MKIHSGLIKNTTLKWNGTEYTTHTHKVFLLSDGINIGFLALLKLTILQGICLGHLDTCIQKYCYELFAAGIMAREFQCV
jgi:hypothetical protein